MSFLLKYLDQNITFWTSPLYGGIISIPQKDVETFISDNGEHAFFDCIYEKLVKSDTKFKKKLSVMVLSTYQCNLACSYCFEGCITKLNFKELRNCKTDLVLDTILKIYEKGNYEELDVTFSGGEPLLNFKPILSIVNSLETHINDISYSIITNGFLVYDKHIDFFEKFKFSVQITLDGDKYFHNKERVTKSGIGTYEKILSNIEKITENNICNVSVRLNTTKFNYVNFEEPIKKLSEFKNIQNIKVYFAFLDVEKENEYYINTDEKKDIAKYMYDILYKYNVRTSLNYIDGGMCMYKNNNSFTIVPDGGIFKCYSLVSDNNFKIPANPTIDDIKGKGSMCNIKECEVYELCYGGCPYVSYTESKTMKRNCIKEYIIFENKYIFFKEIEKFTGKNCDFSKIYLVGGGENV